MRSKRQAKTNDPSVNELEADVAYFDARLSMLGKPVTRYQKAQEVAYRLLEGLLIKNLVRKRNKLLHRVRSKKQQS
ncbi:hypothetical protein MNBD_GAMMA26-1812 [hydrothermal vent metagenome]|uniref:Uncharacterized protein n=1 Tax=hydrothermal vent metagenome TaxID=652676 RepID=A0A3B1BFW1_9ZZZZ